MAVLDFAAHTLDYQIKGGGHKDRLTGDYITEPDTWIERYCKCDIVPNGKADTIALPDGQFEQYQYTIYNLPRNCRKFEYGDKVRVRMFDSDDDVREFSVKGFHRYQLQCKMWV